MAGARCCDEQCSERAKGFSWEWLKDTTGFRYSGTLLPLLPNRYGSPWEMGKYACCTLISWCCWHCGRYPNTPPHFSTGAKDTFSEKRHPFTTGAKDTVSCVLCWLKNMSLHDEIDMLQVIATSNLDSVVCCHGSVSWHNSFHASGQSAHDELAVCRCRGKNSLSAVANASSRCDSKQETTHVALVNRNCERQNGGHRHFWRGQERQDHGQV